MATIAYTVHTYSCGTAVEERDDQHACPDPYCYYTGPQEETDEYEIGDEDE